MHGRCLGDMSCVRHHGLHLSIWCPPAWVAWPVVPSITWHKVCSSDLPQCLISYSLGVRWDS